MIGLLLAFCLTGANVGVALYARHERRRTARLSELRMAAVATSVDLQATINNAWDAAHEFGDDPQQALSALCEYLEPRVTPLPADGEVEDAIDRWLREERWS